MDNSTGLSPPSNISKVYEVFIELFSIGMESGQEKWRILANRIVIKLLRSNTLPAEDLTNFLRIYTAFTSLKCDMGLVPYGQDLRSLPIEKKEKVYSILKKVLSFPKYKYTDNKTTTQKKESK
ncbi:MAG: hypothetical protein BAJALOKI1v1_800014 [Promethearchaeota archaeon]|nr:MAG: hypothetical protein BAJALOKI1v1_800014 [Candidatus Lokiarchaeota archaeon]